VDGHDKKFAPDRCPHFQIRSGATGRECSVADKLKETGQRMLAAHTSALCRSCTVLCGNGRLSTFDEDEAAWQRVKISSTLVANNNDNQLKSFLCFLLTVLKLFHCFTLSSKPTFSENLILHLSLLLSVGLISWL